MFLRLIILFTVLSCCFRSYSQQMDVKTTEELPRLKSCKALFIDLNKDQPLLLERYSAILKSLNYVEIQASAHSWKLEQVIEGLSSFPVNKLVIYIDADQVVPRNLDTLRLLTDLRFVQTGDGEGENFILTKLGVEFINLFQNDRFIRVEYYAENEPSDEFIYSFYDVYPNSLVEVLENRYTYPDPALKANYEAFPFVNPLVSDSLVRKQSFLISTQESSALLLPSGTYINVPDNAFVDNEGNVVLGSVQVDYREFNDPVTIALSGISMKVNANSEQVMESAGMFEINFSANGEPVYVKEDKIIEVNIISDQKENNYSQFAKTTELDSWEQIGDSNVMRANNVQIDSLALTPAYYAYREYRLSGAFGIVNDIDDNSLDNRFYSVDYLNQKQRDDISYYDEELPIRKVNYRYAKYEPTIKLTKVRRDAISDDWKQKAIVQITAPSRDFPELTVFRNVYFELVDHKRKTLRKNLISRKVYCDIRIEHKQENEFVIKLKDTEGRVQELVALAYISSLMDDELRNTVSVRSKYEQYIRKFDNRNNKHQRTINKVLAKNAKIVRRNEEHLAKQKYIAWKQASKLMNARERSMTFSDWKVYTSGLDSVYVDANGIFYRNQVERSFAISGAGIYNIDRIMKIGSSEPVDILVNSDSQLNLDFYYIPAKVNTCIHMYPENAYVIKNKAFHMIVVNRENGEIGLFADDMPELEDSRRKSKLNIEVEFYPKEKFRTLEQFEEAMILTANK